MRAITEFELIQDNDRIMIGVSGGKDSIFLAYAMAMMRQRIKKKFELMAVTVNPMFSDSFDLAPIKDFMQRLDIPHYSLTSISRELLMLREVRILAIPVLFSVGEQ